MANYSSTPPNDYSTDGTHDNTPRNKSSDTLHGLFTEAEVREAALRDDYETALQWLERVIGHQPGRIRRALGVPTEGDLLQEESRREQFEQWRLQGYKRNGSRR